MPIINKVFTLEVTPEQYVNACDEAELTELDYLIRRKLEQKKQPQTHKENLKELRVNDPITYSELTSDPTGSGGDSAFCIYLIIALALGVMVARYFLF